MYDYESNPEAKGVEYQVTTVDPTDPTTKGKVYQVHKVSEEVAATLGGKVYRARIISDPSEPTVVGKVYQIVLIGDPDDPSVKGKVYNAILTGGSQVVVIGPAVSPLVLPDAIADSLTYVKAFGGTEQNGTPTPDAPMDIVSNNGVVKARHQSGLPLGYTLLDYIESTGTQYIDTGITLGGGTNYKNTDIKLEYDAVINQGTKWQVSGTLGSAGIFIGVNPENNISYNAGRSPDIISDVTNPYVRCLWINDAPNGRAIVKNMITGVNILDATYTPVAKTNPLNILLFNYPMSDGSVSNNYMYGKMYGAKIYNNGTLIRNFVPAKNSSDVVGMYDLVSGQFFTNAGAGEFTAGNPVNDIEIYTDGTVETINVHGKNLFDKNSYTEINAYVNANTGVLTQGSPGANTQYCAVIPCKPNTTYTISGRSTSAWGAFTSSNIGTTATSYNKIVNGSITTGANDIYLIGLVRANSDTVDYRDVLQVEQGSTATEYEPYYDGGTATAEMLLKVGDYQDVQSIIDGVVTRNVGVKVLNGTENWVETGTFGSSTYRFAVGIGTTEDAAGSLCTHIHRVIQSSETYQISSLRPCIRFNTSGTNLHFYAQNTTTTLEQFKQWLAAQYAAGTPVIVIYPLETPTTESVTGQTLQVQDGDNTLEITQASLDNLELEAQYNAAVSLTIQEVQDANLDNNVTVTIQ